jgi:hypothetical protein
MGGEIVGPSELPSKLRSRMNNYNVDLLSNISASGP